MTFFKNKGILWIVEHMNMTYKSSKWQDTFPNLTECTWPVIFSSNNKYENNLPPSWNSEFRRLPNFMNSHTAKLKSSINFILEITFYSIYYRNVNFSWFYMWKYYLISCMMILSYLFWFLEFSLDLKVYFFSVFLIYSVYNILLLLVPRVFGIFFSVKM